LLEISSNADTDRRVGDVISSENGKPQPMQSQLIGLKIEQI
jgi:hypothetical protein